MLCLESKTWQHKTEDSTHSLGNAIQFYDWTKHGHVREDGHSWVGSDGCMLSSHLCIVLSHKEEYTYEDLFEALLNALWVRPYMNKVATRSASPCLSVPWCEASHLWDGVPPCDKYPINWLYSSLSWLQGTPWRNGSASDSRSEGCVFESRRGQCIILFWWLTEVWAWTILHSIVCQSHDMSGQTKLLRAF